VPRRNRPPRATPAGPPAAPSPPLGGALGWATTERAADGDWLVRTVPGAHGRKTYRCPGCDHEIAPGVGHVVAWPAPDTGYGDGGSDGAGYEGTEERRHWHTNCWQSRHRRRPGRRAVR
jgi:hypothetical protein